MHTIPGVYFCQYEFTLPSALTFFKERYRETFNENLITLDQDVDFLKRVAHSIRLLQDKLRW